MANWFKYKFFILLLLPIGMSMIPTSNSIYKKWGFFGHKRINRIAIFTLPPQMFGFYKDHIEYLTEHAVDPDKRRYAMEGEAQCHYIDIDHYSKNGDNPFEIVPRRWTDAVAKYSEDTLQAYGIVPWHLLVMKNKLKWAFENRNVDLILKYSADIGHYVGDAHVPLHTTENYNGQMTGQRGIHGLWESRLVEINEAEYDYFVGKAKYIDRPLDWAWEIVSASHYALDSVFNFEKELTNTFPKDKKYAFEQRGNTTIQTYSYDFSQEYHRMLDGQVERRLKQSIISVGSIWYTTWVEAGQPDLGKLQNTPPSAALISELKQLDEDYHNGAHKGRTCD
jgi:hypothetical protein